MPIHRDSAASRGRGEGKEAGVPGAVGIQTRRRKASLPWQSSANAAAPLTSV
jgi:hypothetical protein